MKNYKILCFDSWGKYELLSEELRGEEGVRVTHSKSVGRARTQIKLSRPNLVLLGGEARTSKDADYPSLRLAALLLKSEKACPDFLITTWDSEEAEVLKHLLPNTKYVPFHRGIGKLIKRMARKAMKDGTLAYKSARSQK